MDEQQIKALLEKYRNGTCSDQEKAILESWYNHQAADSRFNLTDEQLQLNLEKIGSHLPLKYPGLHQKIWPRIAAVASILVVMASGLIYYTVSQSAQSDNVTAKQDIRPGGNKAYLTLANGKRISLTEASNGEIAKQAGITITKAGDGKLIYSIAGKGTESIGESGYNTIETPRGGQYYLKLPDGTEVWLNAQSSLRYPASFETSAERRVELSGEGYFEVAKDKLHPFIVRSGAQEVRVLGTRFNISSYPDEQATETTLLEGSVQLNGQTVLTPGQQASIPASGKISIRRVEADEVVAWKNGKFIFADENIESIMRKLSRWYNLEVIYDGAPPSETFTASIGRFDHISKILDKLSYTKNVHFKIEGRRVTVMK